MSNTFAREHDQLPGSDRRSCLRQPIPCLAYVELDEGNGGIILNLSEGGLSVQAVTSLMEDFLPGVRFQLAETGNWIEAKARVIWTNQSRKLAGLEFIELSEPSRGQIRDWLNRETVLGASSEASEDPQTTQTVEAAVDPGAAMKRAVGIAQPIVKPPGSEPIAPPEFAVPVQLPEEEAAEPEFAPPKFEVASSALADWLTSVSDRSLEDAPQPAIPPPAEEPPARQPFVINRLIENNWSALTVLLLLALASLVAGWAAGHGSLGHYLARVHLVPGGADQGAASVASSAPVPHPAVIEVLSVNGQRWTISFDGPSNAPTDNGRQASGSGSYTPARKPETEYRTWILTPPSPRRAAANEGAWKLPPPVLSETPSASENVLTPSGGLSSHAFAGAPSLLPVPAPPKPTGIVRQGQLIRRVDPAYPAIAKEQHAEGTVRLNLTVGTDGVVRGVALLGGPRLLIDTAEKAVRQWRYSPTLLDGKPVEFQREVDLTFRLSRAAR
jgi:TonB family protein